MKNSIQKVLQTLKNDFGVSIFTNPQRTKAALLDMPIETDGKKIRFILNTAVGEMHIYSRLESALVDNNFIIIDKLVNEMSSDYMIDKAVAKAVVEAFVELLGAEGGTGPLSVQDNGPVSLPSAAIPDSLPQPASKDKPIKAGSVIKFGKYNWRVLRINGNNALIITQQVLECKVRHDTFSVIWEQSNLRKHLNSDFYNMFTPSEQGCINLAHIKNPDNARYGTSGGMDTDDRVFLLSIGEANTLFDNNTDRVANSEKHHWASWWWLRSPGKNSYSVAVVDSDGSVNVEGSSVYSLNCLNYGFGNKNRLVDDHIFYGVRPALLLNLPTFTSPRKRRRTDI